MGVLNSFCQGEGGQAWNWLIHKDFYLLTLLPRGGDFLAHGCLITT